MGPPCAPPGIYAEVDNVMGFEVPCPREEGGALIFSTTFVYRPKFVGWCLQGEERRKERVIEESIFCDRCHSHYRCFPFFAVGVYDLQDSLALWVRSISKRGGR